MELLYDKLIPITVMLTLLTIGTSIALRDPKGIIVALLISTMGVFLYFEIRNEKLNRAIASYQPLKCDEQIYNEYEIKGNYLVSNGKSFNIVRGECEPADGNKSINQKIADSQISKKIQDVID